MTDPTIKELQKEAYRIADNHGFHDEPRDRTEVLALIHSEVSEALEADRNDEGIDSYAEELADIVIRVLDHAEEEDIRLQAALLEKMKENRKREYRHGKEY